MQRRQLFQYGAGALAMMLGIGWWRVDGPGAPKPTGQRPLPLTAMDFRLTDHEGHEVGPETLIGRPTMVFFGFTYCPDVCPTTLSDISGWLEDLGDEAAQMNVVFITVDRRVTRSRPWPNMSAIFIRPFGVGPGRKTRLPALQKGFGLRMSASRPREVTTR